METVRVCRNGLCPCGSGRKSKRCCQNQLATGGIRGITAFEKARPVFGDGAETRRTSPRPSLQQHGHDDCPIERIPIHYTYAEPFGEAECVYCFPVEQLFLLEDGSVIPAVWLQPGMRFRLEDGAHGTVTAVEPPRVWEPPSRIPNRDGNYARRVLGRVKHKGYVVLDVTFGGTTVTTTPNHLFYSASRGAWVPVGSMCPGELLRGETGATSPVLAIGPPRQGFVELYGIEVEELHTYFVGNEPGSALVHNGMGECFKKPAAILSSKMQTLDLGGTWRNSVFSQQGLVYVLRDKLTGQLLKVGQTTADKFIGRFEKYVTAGKRNFKDLAVDVFEVPLDNRGVIEGQIRRNLGSRPGSLPWDNQNGRLGRPGAGIPPHPTEPSVSW